MTNSKPAFSPRLRRLDPLLKAEDTNALYQAFRARRVEHGKRWFTALEATGESAVALRVIGTILALFVVGPVISLILPPSARIFGFMLVFAMFVGLAVAALKRSAARSSKRLPSQLMAVLTPRGIPREPAVDVWMTPASARDVVEALYLEHREGAWMGCVFASFIGWLVAMAFLLGLLPGHGMTVRGVVLLVVVAWMFVEMVPALFAMSATNAAQAVGMRMRLLSNAVAPPVTLEIIERQLSRLGDPAWWAQVGKAIAAIIVGVVLIFLVVIVLILGAGLIGLLGSTGILSAFGRAISWIGAEWVAAVALALVAYGLRRRPPVKPIEQARQMLAKAARRAERVYPLCIGLLVLEDPDMRAWADAQFGDTEAFEKTMEQEFPAKTIFGVIKLG